MEMTGLPQLYIHKLGHDIEEIRIRALNHILFKLEHKLISAKELALNSELIKQLVNWFDFEPIKESGKVINLLLELLTQDNNGILPYWQYIGAVNKLKSIRKRIPSNQLTKFDELLDLLLKTENKKIRIKDNDFISSSNPQRSFETEVSTCAAEFEAEAVNDELQQTSYTSTNHSSKLYEKLPFHSKLCFPLQPLSPGDFNILLSVEHSLSLGLDKLIKGVQSGSVNRVNKSDFDQDDDDTLIRCCQFIFDVILRDFLPEVFLQQPGIVTTLLELLSLLGGELESGFSDISNDGKTHESLHWVIKCLHRLATSLHTQLLFYSDPSIKSTQRDDFGLDSSQNTPLAISPVSINALHRRRLEAIVKSTNHLNSGSEENLSSCSRADDLEKSHYFSLPRFCISVLLQSLSLIISHISASHLSLFQSLMSLSTTAVLIMSRIFDSDIWITSSPLCAAITGGILEIFQMFGEVLLMYQQILSRKKGNTTSESLNLPSQTENSSLLSSKTPKSLIEADFESYRLAYIQMLFLTNSFLKLAPKEVILCQSSTPKELTLALVLAIFDPPLHILFPNEHADILKFVKCISPETASVCERSVVIAKSVKMGIRILRGERKSLKDIDQALIGLAFHESAEIVKRICMCCILVDYPGNDKSKNEVAVNTLEQQINDDFLSNKMSEKAKKITSLRSEMDVKSGNCRRAVGCHMNFGKLDTSDDQFKSVRTKEHSKACGKVEGDNFEKSTSKENVCYSDLKEFHIMESESRILIILKLLSHESSFVSKETYSFCREMTAKLLGTASARKLTGRGFKMSCVRNEDFLMEHLSFIWNRLVFTEVVVHGATSVDEKIQNCAKEMILFVLKGKSFVGENLWSHIMEIAIIPSLPLLQCFADSVTPLGKTVTKMFDPDISTSIGMDAIDVLRGNCRLLLNSERSVRDEAAVRLTWILSQEDQDDSRDGDIIVRSWKKVTNRLPDRDTLISSGHNTLANAFVFTAEECNFHSKLNSKPLYSPEQSESICQLLNLIGKECDVDISLSDARVCRSALNQLSLMLEHNAHLHATFLQNNGLHIAMKIFQGALAEDDYFHYPECVIPVTSMLKHVTHWNPQIRKQLSQQEVVYHCILRAVVLFYNEKAFRYDALYILCLLLFNDYILLLQSCPSPSNVDHISSPSLTSESKSFNHSLSLPYILTKHFIFPFPCAVHWRTSHHTHNTPLSPSLMPEKDVVILPKSWVNWRIVGGVEEYRNSLPWQGLIRAHGSLQWHGREVLLKLPKKNTLTDAMKEKAGNEEVQFPPLLEMTSSEVSDLKATDISTSCQSLLFDIQNATTHASVEFALQRLRGYVSLWNIVIREEAEHQEQRLLPWSTTIGRFLSQSPASHEDSQLLVKICSFLRCAGEGFAAKQILGMKDMKGGPNERWLEGLLQDPITLQPLLCPFDPPPTAFPHTVCFTQEAFDGCPSRRAVCREVLSLIRELAGRKKNSDEVEEIGWAYAIYFIAQSLHFGDAERFYDLAFLEWALSCLVQLTGSLGWGHSVNKISSAISKTKPSHSEDIWGDLISGLIELLSAFCHGSQPLPNWASEEGGNELSEKNINSRRTTRITNFPDEPLLTTNLEVIGSFMGLSITRSALLCLNHILSEMQDSCLKSSQVNWEIIWSKVLMNAGRSDSTGQSRALRHGSLLQGWLLPLWSSRDPIIRAAALQLSCGISLISSPIKCIPTAKNAKKSQSSRISLEQQLGLRLLDEGWAGKPGGVWGTSLSIFVDHCESCLVREQAALLLSNLIAASEKIPDCVFDIILQDGLLFKEIGLLASQLYIGHSLPKLVFADSVKDDAKDMEWSTPGLVLAASQLLQNIMTLKPCVVTSAIWEANGFLFRRLFKCLQRIPKEENEGHLEAVLYVDTLGLYSEILSFFTSAMLWDTRLVILLPQPNPLTSVFMLFQSKYYKNGQEFEDLKNKLWSRVFGFISATLGSLIDQQGKPLLGNNAAVVPEKYYDLFLEAAYESIIGKDLDLRKSALYSVNALLSFELQHSTFWDNEDDILESSKNEGYSTSPLLKLFNGICFEHGEMKFDTESSPQNSLEEISIHEESVLKSESAFKLCHLLIQLYEEERDDSCMAEVSLTLSSLLALSVQAKSCALTSGLMEKLVTKGQHLHVFMVMAKSEESLLVQPKPQRGIVNNNKRQPKKWMKDMRLFFRLLTNFLHSGIGMGNLQYSRSSRNSHVNPVKLEAVKLGLSDVLHKLFPFAMLGTSILSDFLRLLCTFTTDFTEACQSLVYTSKTVCIGPRQNLASSSLLHLLCELASKEMDSLLFDGCMVHQTKRMSTPVLKEAVDILSLILDILKNACDVQECRMVMAKGVLFRSLIKLHPGEKRNNQQLVQMIEEVWLHFLLHFTSFSEGQLSIPKIPEMFDLLLCLSKKPAGKQNSFLLILRNLAFHPQNRARLLSSDDFIETLLEVLSQPDRIFLKEVVGSTVWALAANNYKGKQVLKGFGLENALKAAISFVRSVDDGVRISNIRSKDGRCYENMRDIERISDVLKSALSVLGCEAKERYSL